MVTTELPGSERQGSLISETWPAGLTQGTCCNVAMVSVVGVSESPGCQKCTEGFSTRTIVKWKLPKDQVQKVNLCALSPWSEGHTIQVQWQFERFSQKKNCKNSEVKQHYNSVCKWRSLFQSFVKKVCCQFSVQTRQNLVFTKLCKDKYLLALSTRIFSLYKSSQVFLQRNIIEMGSSFCQVLWHEPQQHNHCHNREVSQNSARSRAWT